MRDHDQNAAHNSGWRSFEAIVGLPSLTALALHLVLPLRLPYWLPTTVVVPGGIVLAALGITLIVLGRRELARHHQPTDPGYPTEELIITGVFAFSRNPLYLGGCCVLVGAALAFGLGWVLVASPLAIVACHRLLIVPEEQYLAARFGESYRRYTSTVCRWLGRNPL